MPYISLDKDNNTLLIDEKSETGTKMPFCESLFSFLEMDLTNYDKTYKIINKDDFSYTDFLYLESQYPQTYKNIICDYRQPEPDDDSSTLRDLALLYLTDNLDNFEFLYEHPIYKYSNITFSSFSLQTPYSDLDFGYLQQYCKSLLDFCFTNNDPRFSSLSKQEKYFIFSAATPAMQHSLRSNKIFFSIPSKLHTSLSIELFKTFTQKYNPKEWLTGDPARVFDLISDSTIKKIKEKNIQLLDVAYCDCPFDILAFEIKELFAKDIELKRCANCGKLFIPSGKYNTDCCDRIPAGQKYSCKKIMTQKRRRDKINANPIIKEYERAYKRNYARVSNHKMDPDAFRLWVDDASKKRDDLFAKYKISPSEQIVIDFKKYLGNK